MVYYALTLSKQPAFKEYARETRCPIAEEMSKRVFSVPVHPGLKEQEVQKVIEALQKVSNHYLK